MKKSTIISLVVASVFTGAAINSWFAKPTTTQFKNHKSSVVRNAIVSLAVARSIRQTANRNSRSNSGGGSSYGK